VYTHTHVTKRVIAAAQGHPSALYNVGQCHEHGYSVAADVAEAVHWYRRAQAAGVPSEKKEKFEGSEKL
jgi:hypothetical protein